MLTAGNLDFPGVAFLAGEVSFDRDGASGFGVLPAGSLVYDAMIVITTAFNAGTVNRLMLGTAASPTLYLDVLADTSLPVGLHKAITKEAYNTLTPAGGTRVFFRTATTGTAPTTGDARAYILYLPALR